MLISTPISNECGCEADTKVEIQTQANRRPDS